jgi:hypothetical protein
MPARLRRPALLALVALALPVLAGCDLLSSIQDFLSQPTTQELDALRDAFGCDVEPASIGGSNDGALAGGDCQLTDGSYADLYAIKLSDAGSVEAELASDDFDAYLALFDAGAELIGTDDDGGDDTDARLVEQLRAGLYVVAANSARPGETGDFRLRVARD